MFHYQARIQGLKKTVAKGDKKKKKEIAEDIAKLESELEKSHKEQMEELESKISDLAVSNYLQYYN